MAAVYNWAELFAFHFLNKENVMKHPNAKKISRYESEQVEKREMMNASIGDVNSLRVTEDDLIYKIIRLSVEEIDVCIVETSCCCNVKVL